jgi:hypothetical protein
MERCWKSNPDERPQFSTIYKILSELAEELDEQTDNEEEV